ncbi:hypothetical protein [Hymenobacter sp. YC55]|uniref:hypothetical protein n=1 Tax=Hymenobacter sp. YC55 TaxID=3034019 RepID=UPI0023F63E8B|nr:hypothetical protein [Hymenobacter sp. YC55]MDF7810680.1 hypothetical protein [Hymenobacter sp. YC55]
MRKSQFFSAEQIRDGEMQQWLALWDESYRIVGTHTVRGADGTDILVIIVEPE